MTENDDKSICRSKFYANGMQYFKLFEKHIPTEIEGNVLLVSIGNPDCISYIINLNPNAIYYVYDSVYVNNILSYNNAFNITFNNLDNDNLEQLIDSIDMKFDCIIMNPPYQKNLHLKILAEAIKHLKDDNSVCVNLSPVRWLQDPLAKYKKASDLKRFEESIAKHLTYVGVIGGKECSAIFQIATNNDLAIYVAKAATDRPFDILTIGSSQERDIKFIQSLFIKISSICKDRLGDKIEVYSKRSTSNYVLLQMFGGHPHRGSEQIAIYFTRIGYGWFANDLSKGKTLDQLRNENPHITNGKIDNWPVVCFNTSVEAKNFFDVSCTTFYKYLTFAYSSDIAIYSQFHPFLGEATNPRTGLKGYQGEWTDDDLYQFFNITSEEQKLIEDTMKKYEAK